MQRQRRAEWRQKYGGSKNGMTLARSERPAAEPAFQTESVSNMSTSAAQQTAQSAPAYQNAFRAELRGDGRMAGAGARDTFSAMVRESSASAAASSAQDSDTDGGGFIGFIKTVIDIINPLQHIPVISTMYRHITGDEISPVARIAGGALFGGPIGLAAGIANAAVEDSTGKDIGETMLAMVTGGDKKAPAAPETQSATMLAAADIIWNDASAAAKNTQIAAADTAQTPGKSGRDIEKQIRESRAAQVAALDSKNFPSSDTPTTLRTQTGGNIGPDGGSLPSVSPAIQAKTGMLAPTQTADRTHTGQTTGAGRFTAPDVGDRNPATHQAKATPVLQSQNAPVGAARKASPPEQIAFAQNVSGQIASSSFMPSALEAQGESGGLVSPASNRAMVPQQMMAALDKYAALKKSQNAAAASGQLVPSLH